MRAELSVRRQILALAFVAISAKAAQRDKSIARTIKPAAVLELLVVRIARKRAENAATISCKRAVNDVTNAKSSAQTMCLVLTQRKQRSSSQQLRMTESEQSGQAWTSTHVQRTHRDE